MAETKTRSPGKAKARPASKQRSKAKSRPRAKAKAKSANSVPAKAKAVGETLESGAQQAGSTVGRAVSKAKVPLVAGGAVLAGVAGGAALGAHQARRHRGLAGVSSDDLAKAARKMGDFGAQMGEMAIELRRARQASNGNGKHQRSPIEVVLQGLTSRR
jgi:hypothetical protein